MDNLQNTLILVLNLKREDQRRISALSQLNGVDFEFIEAIDGSVDENMGSNLVTPPVDAIWQSHVKAYKKFLKTDLSFCLILEDDFHISKRELLWETINGVKNFAPDVVQLGWLETGLDIRFQRIYEGTTYRLMRVLNWLSRYSKNLANLTDSRLRSRRTAQTPKNSIPDSFLPGAHGYLISRKFAESVIPLNSPTFLAADDFLMALSKMRSLNFMRMKESLIEQAGTSQVGSERFTRN